jgi:hypothetical protein
MMELPPEQSINHATAAGTTGDLTRIYQQKCKKMHENEAVLV